MQPANKKTHNTKLNLKINCELLIFNISLYEKNCRQKKKIKLKKF